MRREIVLIAHNLRSCHNVGSLFRTVDGMGVSFLYLTGYTPYPAHDDDIRLPHLSAKINHQIIKTSLGAEKYVSWRHNENINDIIHTLKKDGFTIVALEQAAGSVMLPEFTPSEKIVVIVGRETEGIEPLVLESCDRIVEIPMLGNKESLNVVQAAAMMLYHCRFS